MTNDYNGKTLENSLVIIYFAFNFPIKFS